MYQLFLEIGFEAELNTEEDPELLEPAKELCNENQDTRAAAITELRKMVFEREECFPFRTDDEFMLRFLRAKDFIVPRAHKLMVRYCNFREEHKHLYDGVDLWGLGKVKNAYEGNMSDRPDVGRIGILRFGVWDTNEMPIEDLLRAATAIAEISLRQPKIQVIGTTLIVDLEGITIKHMAAVTPTVAYQIVCLMGLAIPMRLRSIHLINYSWMLSPIFFLFKRFIPQQAWDAIHFHGSDLKSLQRHIDLECLPPRFGGTCRSGADFQQWLKKIRKYRTEQFDKDMKQLGYVIKE
ncbi:unnamed protein product [Arctia plantaginis]|uniref:CRAL-TRIO domain-containing protein n=1 Tax=Arctia plantaginis TaxID=874455 RepID=A0A8S1AEU7_ARCPL|nr:unnamed protein product [Arctia plantaginis]CAB3260530.1 unnamed protein product [Arctia plantaginis]